MQTYPTPKQLGGSPQHPAQAGASQPVSAKQHCWLFYMDGVLLPFELCFHPLKWSWLCRCLILTKCPTQFSVCAKHNKNVLSQHGGAAKIFFPLKEACPQLTPEERSIQPIAVIWGNGSLVFYGLSWCQDLHSLSKENSAILSTYSEIFLPCVQWRSLLLHWLLSLPVHQCPLSSHRKLCPAFTLQLVRESFLSVEFWVAFFFYVCLFVFSLRQELYCYVF